MRSILRHITLIVAMLFSTAWDGYVYAQTDASIIVNTGNTQTFSVTKVDGYKYHWWVTNPDGTISEDFPFSFNNSIALEWNEEGNYKLHVQAMDENGCLSEIQHYPIEVKTTEIEVVADAGDDITVCFTDLPVMLDGSRSSQGSDFTYQWSPIDDITNGTSLTPEYHPGGVGMTTLRLTVTYTPTGETDSDEVIVTVLEGPVADAGPDQEIFEGETADLDGSQSTGIMPMTYEWTTNDGNFDIPPAANDPRARVDAVGTYVLTVTDNDGCRDTDEMKVTLRIPRDIDIVNGFTPNGDGTNDVFIIDGIEDYPTNKVMIFNRWGTKVYEGANYNNTEVVWDGTVNTGAMTVGSGQLPTGTYFYIVTLNGQKVGLSGWVYLDR